MRVFLHVVCLKRIHPILIPRLLQTYNTKTTRTAITFLFTTTSSTRKDTYAHLIRWVTMLTRTYVNSRYWFYPIGNTPAVNLLRDVLVQEGGPVNILSLGCGDVRNILFTLWSQGPIKPNVTINVTACDIDPAILARNVFLLSFLVKCSAAHGASGPGDEILDTLWSIYYHFFLTAKSTSALQIHALELVELSVSADRWASSLYGQVFSFLGTTTLEAVRDF